MRQISKNERIKAPDNAIASVETEGFSLSGDEKDLCMQAPEVKITTEEKGKYIFDRLKRLPCKMKM